MRPLERVGDEALPGAPGVYIYEPFSRNALVGTAHGRRVAAYADDTICASPSRFLSPAEKDSVDALIGDVLGEARGGGARVIGAWDLLPG